MESTPSDFHNVSCSRRLISTSGRPYFICSERSKPRRPAGTVVLGRLGHSLIRGAQTPNMNTRGLNGRGSIDINRWLSYGWCCLFSQTWSKANFRKPQMACRSNDVMSPLTSIDYIYIYATIRTISIFVHSKTLGVLASIYPSLSTKTCFFSRDHGLVGGFTPIFETIQKGAFNIRGMGLIWLWHVVTVTLTNGMATWLRKPQCPQGKVINLPDISFAI